MFLDANIFKFSAIKKHVYLPKRQDIIWGPFVHETNVYEPYTVNSLDKVTSEILRKDSILLAMAAFAGISGKLKFYYHREVEQETCGLPGMTTASGRFFECPLEEVADPEDAYSRILYGGGKHYKAHTQDFLSNIRNPRYLEIAKVTGAYQGKDKPLNLNQALDAFHIWCAESAGIEYFMTMDYKLKKVVERSKLQSSVQITTPSQLLQTTVPQMGLFGGFSFLWKGVRFAKKNTKFQSRSGWK